MSVSTSNYTSTGISGIITIADELSSTNIISAVNNFITSNGTGNRGWTLHDTLEGHEPGTANFNNAYSPINLYVFRSLNADGTTYKYLIMRWDIINMWFWTSTCESWNNTTHVSTNECWTNQGAFIHSYDIIDGKIFLSVSPRHFTIWSFNGATPGLWSMICETERDAAENTTVAGYPTWGWTCSLMIGTPYGVQSGPSNIIFAFPRLMDGSTGKNAANKVKPRTIRGRFPPGAFSGTALTIVDSVTNNFLHLGSEWYVTYGWDELANKTIPPTLGSVQKNSITPVYADYESATDDRTYGRIYNVGTVGPTQSFLSTISANLDSTGGWPDNSGSSAPMVALPMNGGAENRISSYASHIDNAYFAFTEMITEIARIGGGRILVGGMTGLYLCSVGGNTYSRGAAAATASPQVPLKIITTSAVIVDVIFDGERYAYFTTSAGVSRIDTRSNANPYLWTVTSLSLSHGGGYASMDKSCVYISGRTRQSTPSSPQVYIISRSTFTLTATFSTGTDVVAAVRFSTVQPTYTGFGIVHHCGNAVTASSYFLQRFNSSTGAQVNTSQYAGPSVTLTYGYGYWLDPTASSDQQAIWWIAPGASALANSTRVYYITYGAGISNIGFTSVGDVSNVAGTYTTQFAGENTPGDAWVFPEYGSFKLGHKTMLTSNMGGFGIIGLHLYNSPSSGTTSPQLMVPHASSSVASSTWGGGPNRITDGVWSYASYYVNTNDVRLFVLGNFYGLSGAGTNALIPRLNMWLVKS